LARKRTSEDGCKGGITREKKAIFLSRGTMSEGQWTELVIEGLMVKKRGQLGRIESSRQGELKSKSNKKL
jgi:hypothetical protein